MAEHVDIDHMKLNELRQKLEELGLSIEGKKPILKKRLQAALNMEEEKEDEIQESDNESSSEEDDTNNLPATPAKNKNSKRQVLLTFRDVEESLEKFSGEENQCIGKWLRDFEEMAVLCEWVDIQKIVYAKRLLTGSARLFVKHQNCSNSWKKLKDALKEGFKTTVDCHKIHHTLSNRKKKNDESYQEYMYKMFDIASPANFDIKSVIKYIIEGIPDDPYNKSILYGAKNMHELKEKFEQYESMKSELKNYDRGNYGKANKDSKNYKVESGAKVKKCKNCGAKGHIGFECPDKGKGAKCFKCNQFGHIASRCSKDISKTTTTEVNSASQPVKRKYLKDVVLEDCKITALIDTGSDLTLISSDEYIKIGSPKLLKTNIKFDGIGSSNIETFGEFIADVKIDDDIYCLKFHVVSSLILKRGLLIGSDFLNTVELHIKAGIVTIKKIEGNQSCDQEILNDISQINIANCSDEIDLSNIVDASYREKVEKLIVNYKPDKINEVGMKMKIILKDDIPVFSRPRRLPPNVKHEVDKIINEWLEEKIVQPSNSEYASPIVPVKKKDGTIRVCVDFRQINKKIIKDRYPLPLIEDQLDLLQDAKIFSTIDLKNGFFHVFMDKDSCKYTSFVTPTGQYEFLRVPFGLCNSPSVFQKFINAVFRDLISQRIVLTYLDDLIVLAANHDEAIEKLQQVLEVAGKHNLIINWKKCQFLQEKIEYLGHIVENGSVKPSEYKTKAVINFPRPKNVKDIQSFLGLTGYFRKFIQNYSMIARPLTNLLKANTKFEFGISELEAFNHLKSALCDKPVLRLYHPGRETELHTDASSMGYGAILMQKDSESNKFHPVYFSSGKTTVAEEKYTSYELEVLAIIKSLRKFRVYLLAIQFTIVTDCQAFTMTMNKKDLCVRVARWALLLEEFNYQIVHRSGKQMVHVDALSRNPLPCVFNVKECEESILTKLKRAQHADEQLEKIFQNIKDNKYVDYEVQNDLLYKIYNNEPLIVVPKLMQTQIVRHAHERGHFGVIKTEALVRKDFWFKNMREKIEQVINNCIDCILAERKYGKREGFLNVINKGSVPLDTFHIDHLGPIPSTRKSYKYIFVVVDAFSKFVWLYATRSTDTADALDRLSKQAMIFGNPRRIISDRGTAFTSNAFSEYCQSEGIENIHITTGVPRSNGQVERVNRTIIPLLTKMSAPKPAEWYKYLPTVQKYLNATPHRSTGKTPFNLLFGTQMRLKEDPEIRKIIEEEWVKMFEEQRDELRLEAKEKIAKIQTENQKTYNKKRKKATKYAEDDLVAISRTQMGPGLKVESKYFGPYRVTKVLRNDRYLVSKVGDHGGPHQTSTSADHMKPWTKNYEQCSVRCMQWNAYDSEDSDVDGQHLRTDVS